MTCRMCCPDFIETSSRQECFICLGNVVPRAYSLLVGRWPPQGSGEFAFQWARGINQVCVRIGRQPRGPHDLYMSVEVVERVDNQCLQCLRLRRRTGSCS